MNKFKAKKDEVEGPNVLREDISSRQTEQNYQRSAQPKQKEPEYKPKHGKKWPAIFLAGIAAVGAYQIGTHGGFEKTLNDVSTYVAKQTQQAQQPPYKKVAAKSPKVHYSHAYVDHQEGHTYATMPGTQYVARQITQPQQMTPQEMQYKLQNRQLSLQYKLQEQQLQAQVQAQQMQTQEQQQQLQAQEQAQAQQLALQQQQQAMQYQIQQRYAAIQQMQGMAYAAQNYANAYNLFRGGY